MKLLNQVDTTQRRHTFSLSLSVCLTLSLSLARAYVPIRSQIT